MRQEAGAKSRPDTTQVSDAISDFLLSTTQRILLLDAWKAQTTGPPIGGNENIMMEFREEVGHGVQAVNALITEHHGLEFSMDTPEGQKLNGHVRQLSGILAGSVECIFVIQPHGSTVVGEITVPISEVHDLLHPQAS